MRCSSPSPAWRSSPWWASAWQRPGRRLRASLLWSFGQPPDEAREPLLAIATILVALAILVLLERWWQRRD